MTSTALPVSPSSASLKVDSSQRLEDRAMDVPKTPTSTAAGNPGTSRVMDASRQNPRFSPSDRRATNLSTASSAMSFGSLPSGTWDVRFHGSCPRCHHWHNKMTLRLSRLPGVYSGVRCENCSYKWFGLGGNSTHTSLVSQQTRTVTFASDFSGRASTGLTEDRTAGASTLLTRLHSMSAVGSPFLTTCTVPQSQEDNHGQPRNEQGPASRLLDRLSSAPGRDTGPLSKHSSQSSRNKKDRAQKTDQTGLALGSRQAENSISKGRGLAKVKAKLKAILRRLRIDKVIGRARQRASCQSVNTTPGTTTENSRPISVRQPRHAVESIQEVQQDRGVAALSPQSQDRFVPRPPSRRQSAPEPRTRSDAHGDDAYQKPFFSVKPSMNAERDAYIRGIRRAKTEAAQQVKCNCPVDCHCRRPTSSLIPDNPLADRASLYHLDLAQSSVESRPSRHSADLAHIGGLFENQLSNSSEPGLSMSSGGSIRGRSQSRRGRENLWRRSNATWESQGTTAYTGSDAGSPTPRRTSFHPHDLLLVSNHSRPRVPSPLASPTYINGFGDGDHEQDRRRSGSVSSVDDDYQFSERAGDAIPSVSPIQEAASGGSGAVSVTSLDGAHVCEGERLSISRDIPVEDGDEDGEANHLSPRSIRSHQSGPLNSHPVT
ncbi:hypothetical protein MPH_10650 [Macrophomina phaseolina MS6]|uniref:Uncharacterized protein n=1 Tax=Macrophomina phaseolina (strain MS6) TaxID=1126212 RepID=K2RCG0_MACPH|nr:hypothetical protein MPH_10650 [Macrophomina phaseolina MS6]